MKLQILSPLPAKYRLKYTVEVEFMFGDGDHYKTEEFVMDDEAQTISFAKRLKGFKQDYVYNHKVDEDPAGGPYLLEQWPYDEYRDRPAYYQSFKVFFYDINGNKCPVKVAGK